MKLDVDKINKHGCNSDWYLSVEFGTGEILIVFRRGKQMETKKASEFKLADGPIPLKAA